MKIKHTFFTYTLIICTLIAYGNVANAQVKIGSNPTTIGANNNLEVEASTAGRKTSIDKTTGQVTVADGTQGLGKVLTSDANGGASWKPAIPTLNAVTIVSGVYPALTAVTMDFTTVINDPDGNFDINTDKFTAPTAGLYLFVVNDRISTHDFVAYNASGSLYKGGGTGTEIPGSAYDVTVPVQHTNTANHTTMVYLAAGEQVWYQLAGSGQPRWRTIHLQAIKLSN